MKAPSIILLGVVVLTASGCGPTEPDETRIRNAIEAMALALEEGEPKPFLERVAEDFAGDDGQWDRQRVRQYVMGQTIGARERPDIDLGSIEVELLGERARATVEVRISDAGRWLPQRGAHYRFETGWREDDGQWHIIRADWERLDR